MATDGGAHPPEKWAGVTASQIINIAADAGRQAVALNSGQAVGLDEAREFEDRVTKILTEHHGMVQTSERDAMKTAGPDGLVEPMHHHDFVDDAVDDIIALAMASNDEGKPRWPAIRSHFSKPEVQAYLRRLLAEHFHHSMVIERSWHADAHSSHKHAKAFHAAMRGEAKPDHPAAALLNPHFRAVEG